MEKNTLKELATAANFHIGAAAEPKLINSEPEYAAALSNHYNCLTAENIMKPNHLQPERNKFDFSIADKLIDFAETHSMSVRGHTLVWHRANPQWFLDANWTRPEAMDLLHRHITTVANHFKGKLFCWDVVNEALEDVYNSYRIKNPWYRFIGSDYVELAFRWAHEADPKTKLFYNDYDLEASDRKFEQTFNMLRDLLDRGTPIHGLGFQFHTCCKDTQPPEKLKALFQRVRTELGLEIHITEMDASVSKNPTSEEFELQAEVYARTLRLALEEPNCKALVMWGLTDKHTWVPEFTNGEFVKPLLFDEKYHRKPAYFAMCNELRK